jgi:hypothetical protein
MKISVIIYNLEMFYGVYDQCRLISSVKVKGKAVPLQAWSGQEGSRKLRFPHFMTAQPYTPAAFTPRKYTWYSFLLEADSTPGP